MLHKRNNKSQMLEPDSSLYQRTRSGILIPNAALFQRIVMEARNRFGDMREWRDRTGGYWIIADPLKGEPVDAGYAGVNGISTQQQFHIRCREKARRLAQHPEHKTSGESREPDLFRYDGAIRARLHIVSMSGLPERGDVICVLKFLYERMWLTMEEAEEIAKLSDNHLWEVFSEVLL